MLTIRRKDGERQNWRDGERERTINLIYGKCNVNTIEKNSCITMHSIIQVAHDTTVLSFWEFLAHNLSECSMQYAQCTMYAKTTVRIKLNEISLAVIYGLSSPLPCYHVGRWIKHVQCTTHKMDRHHCLHSKKSCIVDSMLVVLICNS